MELVDQLAATGLSKAAISRLTRIPRSTVREWLLRGTPTGTRPEVVEPALSALPAPEYAYLLGAYLGDGYIVRVGRTEVLRIYCDAQYSEIMSEIESAIRAVAPGRSVFRFDRPGRCVMVAAYWKYWPLVFPQHGPGLKHSRPIKLEEWQQTIARENAAELVRGLIHSDGCRFIARQPSPDRQRTYLYPRYGFSNRSDDIKRIFCEHLDVLGVEWTRASEKDIQIARKDSVAILDRVVGPKR